MRDDDNLKIKLKILHINCYGWFSCDKSYNSTREPTILFTIIILVACIVESDHYKAFSSSFDILYA